MAAVTDSSTRVCARSPDPGDDDPVRIAHVALWTRQLDAQVAFWREFFQAQPNDRYVSRNRPGFASHFLRFADGATLELMTVPSLEDGAAGSEAVGWAHVALCVGPPHEVDRMADMARGRGLLVSPPRMTGDGYYEAVIRDPDGNRIELVAG